MKTTLFSEANRFLGCGQGVGNEIKGMSLRNFIGKVGGNRLYRQNQKVLAPPAPGDAVRFPSLVPQPGSLDDLQFPVANGDVIHLYDRDQQKYVLYPYENGKWMAGVPVISVGESFWVAKTEPGNWTRHLIIA